MKLQATVTALRTNGRAEITIVTSATGLEQCIVADNGEDWALDDELVLLVLTKEQAVRIVGHIDALTQADFSTAPLRGMADQLRPDEPPPFLRCVEIGVTGSQCILRQEHYGTHCFEPQPDTVNTQEFVREG